MSKKANPALIGVFVLAALAIAAGALIVLGSGKLFRKSMQFVAFFEGSLSGLDVGAPVELRGVRVGSVTRILLEYDTDTGAVATPVYLELDADKFHYRGSRSAGRGMKYHIGQGLRMQLQPQSLITGKLKIMMVSKPGTEARLTGLDPETPEIPTIPMLTESIAHTIEDLPLADIVRNLDTSVAAIAAMATSPQFTNTLASMNDIMTRMDDTMSEVNRIMAAHSPERQQTLAAMRSLEEAGTALRDFLNYLQRHPESLLTGKKEY